VFFSKALDIRSHERHVLVLHPEKDVPSAIVWTVHRWYLDCTAGPEESSTSEIQRLQKFCRCNCLVFTVPRKLERQLTVGRAQCCQEAAILRQIGACQDSDWQSLNLTHSRMGS